MRLFVEQFPGIADFDTRREIETALTALESRADLSSLGSASQGYSIAYFDLVKALDTLSDELVAAEKEAERRTNEIADLEDAAKDREREHTKEVEGLKDEVRALEARVKELQDELDAARA